jgi:hypothetical protein
MSHGSAVASTCRPASVDVSAPLVPVRELFKIYRDRPTFPPDEVAGLAALVIAATAAATLAGSILLRRLKPIDLLREE